VNLATFRATSRPAKIAATFRKLTAAEIADYSAGKNVAAEVASAAYLRMCVAGAENVADGFYAVVTEGGPFSVK
jgi:hypothetical protein